MGMNWIGLSLICECTDHEWVLDGIATISNSPFSRFQLLVLCVVPCMALAFHVWNLVIRGHQTHSSEIPLRNTVPHLYSNTGRPGL